MRSSVTVAKENKRKFDLPCVYVVLIFFSVVVAVVVVVVVVFFSPMFHFLLVWLVHHWVGSAALTAVNSYSTRPHSCIVDFFFSVRAVKIELPINALLFYAVHIWNHRKWGTFSLTQTHLHIIQYTYIYVRKRLKSPLSHTLIHSHAFCLLVCTLSYRSVPQILIHFRISGSYYCALSLSRSLLPQPSEIFRDFCVRLERREKEKTTIIWPRLSRSVLSIFTAWIKRWQHCIIFLCNCFQYFSGRPIFLSCIAWS